MAKYKFNIDKKLPSKEVINKHKNFDHLVGNYKKMFNYKPTSKPFLRNPKVLHVLILILVIALLMIFHVERKAKNEKNIIPTSKGTPTDTIKNEPPD